jgi:excisionase family DNA binding protein
MRSNIVPTALLTVPQAAKHLGTNADRVRALIRAGQLRAVDLSIKPGRRRYRHLKVSRQALADFLSQREALVAPAPHAQRRRRQEEKSGDWVADYSA